MEKTYLVTWRMECISDTPQHAAEFALDAILNDDARFFEVTLPGQSDMDKVEVDLGEELFDGYNMPMEFLTGTPKDVLIKDMQLPFILYGRRHH